MSWAVQLLSLQWRKWEGRERRDALSALHLPCPYLLVKMIDDVTMPAVLAEWTEARVNAISETLAAGLQNLPEICRGLAGSTWPTVCAAAVHLGALAMPTWAFSAIAGGICHQATLLLRCLTNCMWMYTPWVGWDINFLGSCVTLSLSSWRTTSPVPQTTVCVIVSQCFRSLMNLSSIHFKLVWH